MHFEELCKNNISDVSFWFFILFFNLRTNNTKLKTRRILNKEQTKCSWAPLFPTLILNDYYR